MEIPSFEPRSEGVESAFEATLGSGRDTGVAAMRRKGIADERGRESWKISRSAKAKNWGAIAGLYQCLRCPSASASASGATGSARETMADGWELHHWAWHAADILHIKP